MRDGTREKLLEEIADGLKKLDTGNVTVGSARVALLDASNRLVTEASVSLALGWVVSRTRVTEDADDITTAVVAHVFEFENPCPVCREMHEVPLEDEDDEEDDDGSAGPAYLDDQDGPAPEPGSE